MKNFIDISKLTIERYSNRYNTFGRSIQTLGWGNKDQQEYRFQNVMFATDFSGKSVVDIGCGFIDFYKFLNDNNVSISSYVGWDLNQQLLNESQISGSERIKVDLVDIANDDLAAYNNYFNIGIMLGLLNFNLNSSSLNFEYSKAMIKNAFSTVNEVLVVDFLSSYMTSEYPHEDFVFYHNPMEMLEFALTISSNVVLKHNYLPIPQKEFMLYIYK